MRRHIALVIMLIGIIFSVGAGIIIPKSIADSSEKNPMTTQNDNPSHKYYYDSKTGMYMVKAGGGV